MCSCRRSGRACGPCCWAWRRGRDRAGSWRARGRRRPVRRIFLHEAQAGRHEGPLLVTDIAPEAIDPGEVWAGWPVGTVLPTPSWTARAVPGRISHLGAHRRQVEHLMAHAVAKLAVGVGRQDGGWGGPGDGPTTAVSRSFSPARAMIRAWVSGRGGSRGASLHRPCRPVSSPRVRVRCCIQARIVLGTYESA